MIGLREQSLTAMYAGTRLAMSANVNLNDLLLAADGQNQGSVFCEMQKETPHVSSEVGAGAKQWLEQMAPQVPPVAEAAVKWVNHLFSFVPDGCKPLTAKFDDSLYEVRTVVRGLMRFAELRNPLSRCAEDFSDDQVFGIDALPPGLVKQSLSDGVAFSRQSEASKASNTSEMLHAEAGKMLDINKFREQLFESLTKQLTERQDRTEEAETIAGVLRFEHTIASKCLDGQGRRWDCIWEVRTCMAEQGAFAHSTRKMHSFSPSCDRSVF